MHRISFDFNVSGLSAPGYWLPDQVQGILEGPYRGPQRSGHAPNCLELKFRGNVLSYPGNPNERCCFGG